MFPKPGPKKKKGRFTGGMEKKAWDAFAMYIKLKHSCQNGFIKCVTCGTVVNWKGSNKNLQAGHYYNYHNYPQLRFEELNVWPQCYACNVINPEKARGPFGLFIARTLSEEELTKLEWMASPKFKKKKTDVDYRFIFEKYSELNKVLRAEKMF